MSWYKFFVYLASPFVRLFARVTVTGEKYLPLDGPYILAAGSHQTNIETVVLPVYLRERTLHYFAKAELWNHRVSAWFMNATGQVPVERFAASSTINPAMEVGTNVLRGGDVLVVFPEGTFSRDGMVHRGRTGMARMAIASGAPVIPVGLVDMKKINPSGLRLRRARAEIRIGVPIYPQNFGTITATDVGELRQAEQQARALTDTVMHSIAELTGQEYSGRYAKSLSKG